MVPRPRCCTSLGRMDELENILETASGNDLHVSEELLPLVYDELRSIASRQMAGQAPGQTLQATALVHEAWLRLSAGGDQRWNNRAHFFRTAALAMRQILVKRAQAKACLKRRMNRNTLDIDLIEVADTAPDERILEVDAFRDGRLSFPGHDVDRVRVTGDGRELAGWKVVGVAQHCVGHRSEGGMQREVLRILVAEGDDQLGLVVTEVLDVVQGAAPDEEHLSGRDPERGESVGVIEHRDQQIPSQAVSQLMRVRMPVGLADRTGGEQQPLDRDPSEDGEIHCSDRPQGPRLTVNQCSGAGQGGDVGAQAHAGATLAAKRRPKATANHGIPDRVASDERRPFTDDRPANRRARRLARRDP